MCRVFGQQGQGEMECFGSFYYSFLTLKNPTKFTCLYQTVLKGPMTRKGSLTLKRTRLKSKRHFWALGLKSAEIFSHTQKLSPFLDSR